MLAGGKKHTGAGGGLAGPVRCELWAGWAGGGGGQSMAFQGVMLGKVWELWRSILNARGDPSRLTIMRPGYLPHPRESGNRGQED